MAENPFLMPRMAEGYEAWYETVGRRADLLEKALLRRQLAAFAGARSALEVGCGTGHFTRWLKGLGLEAVGLDVSRPMLAEAARLGTRGLVRGDGVRLPFATGRFDLAVIVTTLEFVPDPERVVAEAARVARRGLLVGALNRHSLLGRELAGSRLPPWSAAHLFTPSELADLVRRASAPRRAEISWQTTLWPRFSGAIGLPWGGFVGLTARLD